MPDRSTLTELRLKAYRRILPIVVLACAASLAGTHFISSQIGAVMGFDKVVVPAVGALLLVLWGLAMLDRLTLRALDVGTQLSTGFFLLAKAAYLSWFMPGAPWWEFFEIAFYLPVFFALIYWVNDRARAWRMSWGFLAAFLVLALPYLLRVAAEADPMGYVVAYLHLHVPFAAALAISFLSAYGHKEYLHVQSTAEAEMRARTDPLTQLDNRGGLEQRLEECRGAFERHGSSFSVILTDLDRFKRINDEHGHNVGDAVLRECALTLQARVRGEDRVGRWGGEEFAVVLPRTRLQQAAELAEQLRLRVREASYPPGVRVTASFGVAEFRRGDSITSLIGRADAALYAAKRAGRDQVRVEDVQERVRVPVLG